MLNEKHEINLWGVEFVAFQEVLKSWIDDKSKVLGKFLSIRGMHPKGSKETRIKSLVPLTSNGTIKFKAEKTLGGFKASKDMTLLINQFLNFPKGHDDGIDGVHGLVMITKKSNADVVVEERVNHINKILGQVKSFFKG